TEGGQHASDHRQDEGQRDRAAALAGHVLHAEDDPRCWRHVGDRLEQLVGQAQSPGGQLRLPGLWYSLRNSSHRTLPDLRQERARPAGDARSPVLIPDRRAPLSAEINVRSCPWCTSPGFRLASVTLVPPQSAILGSTALGNYQDS